MICIPRRQVHLDFHTSPDIGGIGSLFHKRNFMLALRQVYSGRPLLIKGLGSEGRATMTHQPDQNRYCVNMVYASPSKRGEAYIIEDILPVCNIELALDLPQTIKKDWLGVTGEELAVTSENGRQKVVVPKLECHASVVLEY